MADFMQKREVFKKKVYKSEEKGHDSEDGNQTVSGAKNYNG